MPVGEDAAEDGRGVVGNVLVDQKKRRVDPFARQHVEQIRRRRRIRPVVVRQVDRRRRAARHVPYGRVAGHCVEHEPNGRSVGERDDTEPDEDEYPHHARQNVVRMPICPTLAGT